MRAIGKTALARQRGDVGEAVFDAFARTEQAQLAHAGHVDQQRAVRQHDQVPPRGGVAALAGVADLAGFQIAVAQQVVDQRRLAHAR
ncbi:hypothetical protein Y695_04098 [Hydrogenophaga sp. T4]|nr:hypothetical protein Y695_04098 [Hydrogenophaga sp. T4]